MNGWISALLGRGIAPPIADRYDRLTFQVIQRLLRPDAFCIDVGCHTGAILEKMMECAPQGKFWGFEPLPHLYKQLRRQYRQANVRLFDTALSDRAGNVDFNYVVSNPGYSGLQRRRYDRPKEIERTIRVQTERLDALLGPEEKVDFMKIDVEGAELQVLQGALQTIRRHQPAIVFEHGLGAADCYGTRPEDIFELLATTCKLHLYLLDEWLDGKESLSRSQFCEQFEKALNYYFLAIGIG